MATLNLATLMSGISVGETLKQINWLALIAFPTDQCCTLFGNFHPRQLNLLVAAAVGQVGLHTEGVVFRVQLGERSLQGGGAVAQRAAAQETEHGPVTGRPVRRHHRVPAPEAVGQLRDQPRVGQLRTVAPHPLQAWYSAAR